MIYKFVTRMMFALLSAALLVGTQAAPIKTTTAQVLDEINYQCAPPSFHRLLLEGTAVKFLLPGTPLLPPHSLCIVHGWWYVCMAAYHRACAFNPPALIA
jgi:hypothetical protein